MMAAIACKGAIQKAAKNATMASPRNSAQRNIVGRDTRDESDWQLRLTLRCHGRKIDVHAGYCVRWNGTRKTMYQKAAIQTSKLRKLLNFNRL
jgi:hypothetical protein